jgi:primosomal protein N' (replication factor Y)
LSDGERHDEWYKVHERRADIVIGARSAIFAPLEKLGIIIVDEEHEPSYKQEESPRYHARDLAVVRAKLEGCVVMLASATPSLESFHNACTGKYELLRMTMRTDGKSLPLIRVVDLRLERRKGGNSPDTRILSEKLRNAIISKLEKNQQIILFLNRRGYNTSLSCMSCGHVCQCQDCAVPMTLHKEEDRLVCHVCGARRVPPKKCPGCSDPGIRFAGFGTERVEQVLRQAFPQARIARVDTDSMQRKHQLRDTLKDFRSQKLDMLIGTQMIAKGLDFPNVTLVGVLNADLALNMPDFRAAERTFQLLVQVAGRAGRGEVRGEVYVQTFAPHVPAVAFARHSDYEGFAQQEFEQRTAFHYPPNTHVVLITSRSKQANLAEFTLQNLAQKLRVEVGDEVRMGEAMASPLAKAHGQFRYQLLLRAANVRALVRTLKGVLDSMTFPQDVIVTWDVDAMSLM